MPVTIEIEGLQETIDALTRLFTEMPTRLEASIDDALQPIEDAIKDYPPEREGSTYKRTYRYRDSVDSLVEVNDYGVTATVGPSMSQDVPYAQYVRGEIDGRSQAWMHVGRWQPILSIQEQYVPDVTSNVEAVVDDLISDLGLV